MRVVWASEKLLELLFTTCDVVLIRENSLFRLKDFATTDQLSSQADGFKARVLELANRIRERVDDDSVALARLLASKEDAEVFGETEFQARDIVHRIAATAIGERFRKKTATSAAESNAPAASSPPSSKTTEHDSSSP